LLDTEKEIPGHLLGTFSYVKEPSTVGWLGRGQRSKTIQGINLIAREGFAKDVLPCYTLHRSLGIPYTSASWHALPDMWRGMLSKGTMKLFLVEDRARPLGSRVVSFSAIVFVTDEFCLEARSTLPPYLCVDLTGRYLLHQSPVLNPEQVASANAAEGLNVVMCFEGWACDGLSPEQVLALREKQSEAFHLALSGYRVKEFLAEVVGREASQWMLDAGAHVRRDYSNYFRKTGASISKSSRRPLLVGLTKAEAVEHPGSYVAGLFAYTQPRFNFSPSQRMLLQHALMGETCERLAASLFISPWTVKKRWHAIYERVADIDNELLPPPIADGPSANSRGAERRRHLLNYLRQHLEELRPFEPLLHSHVPPPHSLISDQSARRRRSVLQRGARVR
jgi:DNA-binding CsgD family transcriptional regulator